MKRLLLLLIIVFAGLEAQAQDYAAKVNTDYLTKLAIPNYAAKYAAFQKYHDSIKQATVNDPRYQELAQQSKLMNSSNPQEAETGKNATEQLLKIDGRLQRNVQEDYSKKFRKIFAISDEIVNMLKQDGYTVAFVFNDKGVKDFIYPDSKSQARWDTALTQCVEGKEKANTSMQRQESIFQCKQEVFGSLLEKSTDITLDIKDRLGL